ncbi:MAG: LysR family transcriptional regulator [Sneathiella sp.]|uniref:LysR family transcriptional regulator n=1 Tax=Sneathiella sp. TaxID=1964365 RepID=UPI003002C5EC
MSGNKQALDGMAVFVQVVESGGFSAAAQVFGSSPSFVSKQITRLEDRLGSRLLNRTTRKISLTHVGTQYFQKCKQILDDANEAERSIYQLTDEPRGMLKISAPVSFGLGYLRDELPVFMGKFPDIKLDIELNDRFVDVVAEGFDLVIRVGRMADSSLISRIIMASRGVVVASPDYIESRGEPQHPSELINHDCISYAYTKTPNYWEFNTVEQKLFGQKVEPRVLCNSAELELSFALAGTGIARMPHYMCERELQSGQLLELFPKFEMPPLGVYAVYPNRLHLSAKVRVFIDFFASRF